MDYDSLTTEYLNYLSRTYYHLLNNSRIVDPSDYEGELTKVEYVNNMFFIKDNYSEKGKEFVAKMNNYRNEILKLIKDENLKYRINGILSSEDILIRNGKVKYLNYMYKDFPLIGVLTHMRYRENSIIDIEKDFICNLLIQQ
ncbi:hypothetical protein E1J38_008210 [Seonamhaeicola sediminis]|uniref:Gliding motility-associated protein GldM N-terminal domain-containing protein n=1 Tax=Seonamhaeicola sediminis TaxID=2528206 RepID=A0A562YE89_9FLAO|nr:hypothetical protein [Seonamhaeicola sediminis]TWO32839.1 hypothetical protein E1J38_008210 [Seonamhaeicola sediminis]